MALAIPAIKTLIKTEKELLFGPPADPVTADAAYTVEATILFKVLTTLATTTTTVGSGSSAGVWPGVIV